MINNPEEYKGNLQDNAELMNLTEFNDEQYSSVLNSEMYIRYYETTSAGRALATKQTLLRFAMNNVNDLIDTHDSYLVLRQRFHRRGDETGATVNNQWAGNKKSLSVCPVNGGEKMLRRAMLQADGLTIDNYNNELHMKSLLADVIENKPDDLRNFYPSTEGWCQGVNSLSSGVNNGGLNVKRVQENNSYAGGALNGVSGATVAQLRLDLLDTLTQTNTSFIKRRQSSNVRTIVADRLYEVEHIIPLHKIFSFFKHYRHLSTKINYELELELFTEQNGKHIICQEGATGTLIADGNVFGGLLDADDADWSWAPNPCFIMARRVIPKQMLFSDIKQQVLNGLTVNYKYPDVMTYRQPYLDTTDAPSWRITNSLSKLLRVFVLFQNSDKQDTSTIALATRTLNPHCVDRCNVNWVQLTVGGVPYPNERYSVNWGLAIVTEVRAERLRAYNDFVRITGSDITFNDWSNQFTIYCFDVNVADAESGTNELVLNWERSAGGGAYNVFACVEYLKDCEIHMDNNVGSVRVSGSA